MPLTQDTESVERLWTLAKETANAGDFPGVLFLLKSLAEKGQWTACVRIGELYETGAEGITQDPAQAVKWYRKALFEIDDPLAHLGIGRALFNGQGVDQNKPLAKSHFEKAFARGEAESGIYLGIIYLNIRDYEAAKLYFTFAAKAGYCFAHIGLMKIAFKRYDFVNALRHMKNTIAETIKIFRVDPTDRRLIGIVTKVEWSKGNGEDSK